MKNEVIIYVSTHGDDSYVGSALFPVRTIQEALRRTNENWNYSYKIQLAPDIHDLDDLIEYSHIASTDTENMINSIENLAESSVINNEPLPLPG